MDTLRIGIIGAGYMGRAHARVIAQLSSKYNTAITAVVDPSKDNAYKIIEGYGGKYYPSIEQALQSKSFDIAVVASPTSTHLDIITSLLENNIEYILVEKPLGNSLEKAYEIMKKYPSNILSKIMVGHIERFNPVFQEFIDVYNDGVIGDIITVSSRRVGPFVPRIQDAGVVLDLAIHDIDLSRALAKREPIKIISFTYKRFNQEYEDSCFIILDYETHVYSIEANRITPYKERKAIVTGTDGVAQIDFISQELEVYTGSWKMNRVIMKKEPLLLEDEAFLKSIKEEKEVPVPFVEGLKSLELAYKALENGNKIVG